MHLLSVLVEFGIVLGIMVLVHEFGHFAVAKLCGVRVETFSIGFGPRLFGWRSGDTDYRISLLPLGGYVKMSGDEPGYRPGGQIAAVSEIVDVLGVDLDAGALHAAVGPASRPDFSHEFNARPRWQRVLIALAGPIANFLLSFVLLVFVGLFHHEVDQYLEGPAIVDYVSLNSQAAKLGLAPGDIITQFAQDKDPSWERILIDCNLHMNGTVPLAFSHNGQQTATTLRIAYQGSDNEFTIDDLLSLGIYPAMQPSLGVLNVSAGDPAAHAGIQAGDQVTQIDNLKLHSVYTLLAYLKDRNGLPSTVYVSRNGQPLVFNVTPEKLDNGAGDVQYRIGFQNENPPSKIVKLPLGEAMVQSFKDNKDDSTLIIRVLKGMFTRQVSVRSLSGPIGIAQQIDIATKLGFWTLVRLMSTISLNLGIFNLLPIPILDGGMILFLAIESIMRRDLNQEIKERVYQVAFVCLIVFAVFVIFNDITKLHHP
jgi:regulator of sigma E protease